VNLNRQQAEALVIKGRGDYADSSVQGPGQLGCKQVSTKKAEAASLAVGPLSRQLLAAR